MDATIDEDILEGLSHIKASASTNYILQYFEERQAAAGVCKSNGRAFAAGPRLFCIFSSSKR
eukprot:m.821183 g.821183  ORF g.821183 m.821183 type:complete len:62 (+) comp59395_c0_seq57:5322-5507(+)